MELPRSIPRQQWVIWTGVSTYSERIGGSLITVDDGTGFILTTTLIPALCRRPDRKEAEAEVSGRQCRVLRRCMEGTSA